MKRSRPSHLIRFTGISLILLVGACSKVPSFTEDLSFLKSHTEIHVLEDKATGARVAVAPAWQGRVMTSTDGGADSASMGWIHRNNIAAGINLESDRTGTAKHIHIFGGEERFWLGPEGGQYALFFPPAPAPYEFEHWKTPALLDTEPFDVVSKDDRRITFKKHAELTNRAGNLLAFEIDRTVELLADTEIVHMLGSHIPRGVTHVAYKTNNSITNRSSAPWTPEKGLVSIWLLGMFKHGPDVISIVPLNPGNGSAVNTDYFGELGPDRLAVTDRAVFMKADGAFRSKIGIPPSRSTGVAAAYDPSRGLLTIIHTLPHPNASSFPYVRSQWMDHENPYQGDLINVYNDGPTTPGEPPLGPFYELESSSPALPLNPGQILVHTQKTMHFRGAQAALEPIAQKILGISLADLGSVFSNN
jgi:hypothetical protein